MSDVSEAPTQDAIAESLLGTGEPEEQTQVEETGVEQQESVQDGEQAEQLETEQQTTEEEADNWLPTEQEKVFPDDVLARYAQRYNLDEQSLANPQIRQLVIDKINSDIFLQQQAEQEEQLESEQETESEQQAEPTREQQLPTREEYFAQIDRLVQQRTDPQVAKDFHAGFLKAFGVPDAEIAKAPPEQAMAFTNLMSKYALNLFNTFAGDMLGAQLPNQISQQFPGFSEMYERSAYGMAWDQVRNSSPNFANLPAYGTKEFSRTLREAEAKFPEVIQALQGADGKIPVQQAPRAYAILAKLATGQNVDPATLQKAAATAARRTRSAEVRRSAGQLGSGKSPAASGQRTQSRFQTNQDLFDDDTMNVWQREHGRL